MQWDGILGMYRDTVKFDLDSNFFFSKTLVLELLAPKQLMAKSPKPEKIPVDTSLCNIFIF